MQDPIFFDNQIVQPSQFKFWTDSNDKNTKDNLLLLTDGTAGVAAGWTISGSGTSSVEISQGLGYDGNGERLETYSGMSFVPSVSGTSRIYAKLALSNWDPQSVVGSGSIVTAVDVVTGLNLPVEQYNSVEFTNTSGVGYIPIGCVTWSGTVLNINTASGCRQDLTMFHGAIDVYDGTINVRNIASGSIPCHALVSPFNCNLIMNSGMSVLFTNSGTSTIGTANSPAKTVNAVQGNFHILSGLSPIQLNASLIQLNTTSMEADSSVGARLRLDQNAKGTDVAGIVYASNITGRNSGNLSLNGYGVNINGGIGFSMVGGGNSISASTGLLVINGANTIRTESVANLNLNATNINPSGTTLTSRVTTYNISGTTYNNNVQFQNHSGSFVNHYTLGMGSSPSYVVQSAGGGILLSAKAGRVVLAVGGPLGVSYEKLVADEAEVRVYPSLLSYSGLTMLSGSHIRSAVSGQSNIGTAALPMGSVYANNISSANISSANIPKAWVSFSGSTGGFQRIYSSHNVAYVSGVAIGHYEVGFITPFSDTNYASFGSVQAAGLQQIVYVDLTSVPTSSGTSRFRVLANGPAFSPNTGGLVTTINSPYINMQYLGY
jgi:hypothetical protein